jgi:ABC-type lipoprotein release transport system permease subunit
VATIANEGISNNLFNTSPRDPLTYVSVGLLITLVSLLATLVPAKRATMTDPMEALRAE